MAACELQKERLKYWQHSTEQFPTNRAKSQKEQLKPRKKRHNDWNQNVHRDTKDKYFFPVKYW